MAHCSTSIFIVAIILMDRLQEVGDIIVNSKCIHRMFMTSIMIAAKSYDDIHFKNTYYAKVAGLAFQ